MELVLPSASVAEHIASDQLVGAFVLDIAVAWRLPHLSVDAVTARCSPEDQRRLLEQRLKVLLLSEHSPSASSASFEHSASVQHQTALAVGIICHIWIGVSPELAEQFAVPGASAEIAVLAVAEVWQCVADSSHS